MYQADDSRYDKMSYKRCGNSGILLPRVSLGMWQNFGTEKPLTCLLYTSDAADEL